jgi:hypothetical protein
MSTKKHGLLTVSGQWARHLRPLWRRLFWRAERRAARKAVRQEAAESRNMKETAQ